MENLSDLRKLLTRLSEGSFCEDYEDDSRLLGIFRNHIESLEKEITVND